MLIQFTIVHGGGASIIYVGCFRVKLSYHSEMKVSFALVYNLTFAR